MSDDLISRKALLEEIAISFVIPILKINLRPEHKTVFRIEEIIENTPIAFDKEKVIGELKELKMIYFLTIANTGDEKMDFAYEVAGNAIDKAIEIIEKGGIE